MYQHMSPDADLCAASSMAAASRGLHVRHWGKTTRIMGMSGALESKVWETSYRVTTRSIERHQFHCAHDPHVECMSRSTPSSRRRQCSVALGLCAPTTTTNHHQPPTTTNHHQQEALHRRDAVNAQQAAAGCLPAAKERARKRDRESARNLTRQTVPPTVGGTIFVCRFGGR